MSIIYDALQKTQRNRANNRDVYYQAKVRRRMFWLDLTLLIVIVSLIIMVLFAYVPRFVKHFQHTSVVKTKVVAQVEQPAPPVVIANPAVSDAQPNEQELTLSNPHGNLVLNGVLLSDDDKIAIISNKTYHQGDYVDGLRLIDIEINKVKLQDGERIYVLRSAG